jgi:hypothetical protein
MAADMDSFYVRGVANVVQEIPDLQIDSEEYRTTVEERKAERIENELSALRDVLDENQFTRYREHLEAEPAW